MKKKIGCFLVFICCFGLCAAQQVVSSGGYAAKSDVSVNWILGGNLLGGNIVALNNQNEQLPEFSTSIKVYPSPAIDFINVEIPTVDESRLIFELYNSPGTKILSREVNYQPTIQVDIHDFSSGIYLLRVRSQNGTQLFGVSKIIKK